MPTIPRMSRIDRFAPEVAHELKFYVYRLIDPRNGETFYVGKGRGDRLFAHVRDEQGLEELDDRDNKLSRIRDIHRDGFEVGHIVHRHGMDEQTAIEVEAALMDAYPGLTNIAGGTGTSSFGAMHAQQIAQRYGAAIADLPEKSLLINVSRSSEDTSLYEATRYAWRLDAAKAAEADFVIATVRGLIVEAFVAREWLTATPLNFPGREERPGRFGFNGDLAPAEIRDALIGKRIPGEFRRRGAANPVRYTWT